jgi:hypothetical protein
VFRSCCSICLALFAYCLFFVNITIATKNN